MISKSLIIVVILGVLSLIASAISPQAEAMMDSRQQFKRFRGEPIRFGKRVPREPIRFGKRVPVFEPYFDY
ncbi:FMRF Peptide [Trichostrongylus colubriformis]|uniref:FMRF Peptide n=1 Tax=Trichostrongylus colubriformis TaxID=6319 RepID=A0AAN8IQY2_TRICO